MKYRVDADAYGGLCLRSRKTGGTGLGLAIAQAIALRLIGVYLLHLSHAACAIFAITCSRVASSA